MLLEIFGRLEKQVFLKKLDCLWKGMQYMYMFKINKQIFKAQTHSSCLLRYTGLGKCSSVNILQLCLQTVMNNIQQQQHSIIPFPSEHVFLDSFIIYSSFLQLLHKISHTVYSTKRLSKVEMSQMLNLFSKYHRFMNMEYMSLSYKAQKGTKICKVKQEKKIVKKS